MAIPIPDSLTLFDEVIDFLANAPTAQAILAYQPSEDLDQRLQYLMQRNNEGLLTTEERVEFDEFLRLSHFVKMLKLKTRIKLNEQK